MWFLVKKTFISFTDKRRARAPLLKYFSSILFARRGRSLLGCNRVERRSHSVLRVARMSRRRAGDAKPDGPAAGGPGEGGGSGNSAPDPSGVAVAPDAPAPEPEDEESLGESDSGDEDDELDEDEEGGWIVDSGSEEDFPFDEHDEEDFDDEPSDFDDDQMHFEIEGDVDFSVADDGVLDDLDNSDLTAEQKEVLRTSNRLLAQRNTPDPEEHGCYLLPDGDSIPSSTGMNHRQGSDSVGAASPGRLLVTGVNDVRLLDADENSETRGTVLASTEKLSFDVYSVTYDVDSGLVAACGQPGPDGDINLAVFKVAQGIVEKDEDACLPIGQEKNSTEGTPPKSPASTPTSSAMFIKVADCGVGETGRYHEREMLNCARFGKLRNPDDVSKSPKNVLLCASQDGHCYVYAIEMEGFSDAGGNYGGEIYESSFENIAISPTGSDGGQGGRGPRRRPRLDAKLNLEVTIDLPTACNAAAASPDGRYAACVGDFENVHLEGGVRGYKKTGAYVPEHVRLSIDGNTENQDVLTNEPEGGMYCAWSGDSKYLAATTDSMCVVAVWRVGGNVNDVTRVAYLYNHAHPCLPVTFLPSDPNVLVWAERGGRVHAYDLRRAERALKEKSELKKNGENLLLDPDVDPVDMSPPRRLDASDPDQDWIHTWAGEATDEENNGPKTLTDAIVADMSSIEKQQRLEAIRVEQASLSRKLHAWAVGGGGEGGHTAGGNAFEQMKVLRRLHKLGNEQIMLQGKSGASERGFVQTIRNRVRGVYVTGVCAVTAPVPQPLQPGDPGFITSLGPASLQKRPPPHDLVFIGVPSGVLRFRAPTAWLPDFNHSDFPKTFRDAARTFLLCAEANSRRAQRCRSEEGGSSDAPSSGTEVCLGDMPQEVLLRVLSSAAVPISDWIGRAEKVEQSDLL